MRRVLGRMSRRQRKAARALRVFVAGRDVTHRCLAFDTRQGWARVYCRPLRAVQSGRAVATEVLHGRVRVERWS
jgi:hypothetical protein